MFCPNCGTNNASEQRFCRYCGLNLERAAESLFEQLPTALEVSFLRRQAWLEKFGDFAWNSFALTILLAIGLLIYHIVTKVPIWFDLIIAGLAFFGLLGIIHRLLAGRAERLRMIAPAIVQDGGSMSRPTDRDLLASEPVEIGSSEKITARLH